MFTYKGIAVTDEINLYNEKFTLQAMYSAYEKQWDDIFPSFANHDHKISIGFSKLTGIYLGKNFSSIKSNVHPFDIINKSGNLSIKRNFVSPEKIESWSKDGLATLLLSEEEKEVIIKHGITAVVAFMDEKVRCSKCGKDYRNCNCISLIDENVVEVIEKAKHIGATWTNRSAFI